MVNINDSSNFTPNEPTSLTSTYWKYKRPRHAALVIQVLACYGHKNVAVLNRSLYCTSNIYLFKLLTLYCCWNWTGIFFSWSASISMTSKSNSTHPGVIKPITTRRKPKDESSINTFFRVSIVQSNCVVSLQKILAFFHWVKV